MSSQQQQQQQTTEQQRNEDYDLAQRAAYESILIGRSTATAVHEQGEQLRRAESLADETDFKLRKANRMLKGMTWGGWVSNLLTPDVKPINSSSTTTTTLQTPQFADYEELPATARPTAQAIQNYHANVTILSQCETQEQTETCKQICNSMYAAACRQLQQQQQMEASIKVRLKTDLDLVRKQQLAQSSAVSTATVVELPAKPSNDATDPRKTALFGRPPAPSTPVAAPQPADTRYQQQDQHLQVLANSLGEISQIAHTLNAGLYNQQDTLERLDTKSSNVLETSQQVGRRTERMIQAKAWTRAKPVLVHAHVYVRYNGDRYLTVLNNEVWLVKQRHALNARWRLYRKGGTIFGLQCEGTRKWFGQGLLMGGLTCTASSLGRREEWQADGMNEKDWTFDRPTRLTCASAGWGQGAYLHVSPNFAISIGTPGSGRNEAAEWTIEVVEDE